MNYLLVGKWVGGIVGGLAIAWAVYAGIIRPVTKPNPTTRQEAQEITNYTYNITPRFGCATIKQFGRINGKEKDISSPDSDNTGSNPL